MRVRKHIYTLLSVVLLLASAAYIVLPKHAQAATTFTVTSTGDQSDADLGDNLCDVGGGVCTLRAAIEQANSTAGADTIEFNITPLDGSVKTIAVDSQLPDVSTEMIIDGYTQDPTVSEPNTAVSPAPFNGTLLVELSGESLATPPPPYVSGLNMVDGSDNSVVRGLVINQFPGAGIAIYSGADGIKVKGNYIGTDPTGLLDKGNFATGITTVSSLHGSEGPDNVVIGGVLAADRNIVSANNSHSNDPNLVNGSQGIAVVGGSDDWVVQGNYIGVGANGTTDLGNELGGMTIDYIDGILIGGDTPGAGNVVSGNGDGGIQPDGVLNLVMQGNYIGTDHTGSAPLPNATKGVTLAYGTENALIGGTTPGAGNIIAYNPAFGVNAWQAETQNVTIIGNSIHDNASGLGIDLSNINSEGGLTINDALDQDAGANNLLNFPDNVQYKVKGGNTDMTYTLDVPAGQYRVEFFSNTTADASGHGEGETFLGSHDIVKTGSGSQAFAHTLTGGSHPNISATATLKDGSADGFGPTSEFSATANERADVTDVSLTKTILNPESVSAGGTVEYQLTITNNGLDDLDLTQFDNPLGTAIISDFLDPDLTPINLGSPEPSLPGSFYLSDVGNPGLTCLWGGPGSGAGVGLTTYGQYSFVICTFTGVGDTTLEADESLSMTLDVSIAGDSDMVFTNYAFATASLLADPDNAAIGSIFGVGGDYLELLIANQSSNSPINNFASAAYPIPVAPTQTTQPTANNGALGTTGQIMYSWQMLAIFSISTALLIHKWRITKTNTYKIIR